jgi:hypothetical protein
METTNIVLQTQYTTPGATGHCIDVPLFFFANGIWTMLVDVCILIVPIPIGPYRGQQYLEVLLMISSLQTENASKSEDSRHRGPPSRKLVSPRCCVTDGSQLTSLQVFALHLLSGSLPSITSRNQST